MISLLQKYKRFIAWLLSGLVVTVLISFAKSHQQQTTAHPTSDTANHQQPALISEFAATHLEPNFYQ